MSWYCQLCDAKIVYAAELEKNYKTKTRTSREKTEEDEIQQGANHWVTGRDEALHDHPNSEEVGVGNASPKKGTARHFKHFRKH